MSADLILNEVSAMIPLADLLAVLLLASQVAIQNGADQKRKTIAARFCGGLPHLLSTGEPVAHACHVLPVDALEAEADGLFLIAERIMARNAAAGPLSWHWGIWNHRRR